jgi:signal peptidase I
VGAICLLLNLFVFDTWLIPGDDPMFVVSTMPTLKPQDRILIRKGGEQPQYGQLARCASPENPSKYVVGRVFGMTNDTVAFTRESITVSGNRVAPRHGCPGVTLVHPGTGQEITLACAVEENPAWTYQTLRGPEPEADRVVKVEPGRLYLVSDNRHLHQDSRDFGTVDASTCQHVVFRLWGDTFNDASRRFNILW